MWRAVVLAIGLASPIGLAHAEQCVPLAGGMALCEEQGSVFLVDPASGAAGDVTQEVVAALAGVGSIDQGIGAEPQSGGGGTFEDRLAGYCVNGGCPSDLSAAIDGITGYIPAYQ